MGTRIHLYALPGLPLHVEDLMPQPLLARCAASLVARGHAVQIIDEGSIDRLDCPAIEHLVEVLNTNRGGDLTWGSAISTRRQRLARALFGMHAARTDRILDSLGPHELPAVVLIQIERRKDVLDARHLARALRRHYGQTCIVIAGNFARKYARPLLSGAPEFDVACVGVAEEALPAIVEARLTHKTVAGVPGILYRNGAGLASSPLCNSSTGPADGAINYHPSVYPSLLDGGKIRLFPLRQSWGLGHAGAYRGEWCRTPQYVRDARALRADMMGLHELYGARAFHFGGAHTPRDGAARLAAECRSLPFDVAYSMDADVRGLAGRALSVLAGSGCRAVGVALLTGSQRLLSDYFGEDWTISEAESCFRDVARGDLHVHADFVYPTPADDRHSVAETLRLIRRCAPDSVRLALPELSPGSAWYQHAREFSFVAGSRRLGRWACRPAYVDSLASEAADLPYTVRGLHRGINGSIQRLLAELDELAVPLASGAAASLIGNLTGEGPGFVRRLDLALSEINLAELHQAIERFNTRATASINTLDLSPQTTMKLVVGD